jgi:hypothetical protein
LAASWTFLSYQTDTGKVNHVAHGVEEGENWPITSLPGKFRDDLRIGILQSHYWTAVNEQAPPEIKLAARSKGGDPAAYFPSDVSASWTRAVLPLPWGPYMNVMVQATRGFNTVTGPGKNQLTKVFSQVLLNLFLGIRPIFPNLGDIGELQRSVISGSERSGVFFQPLKEPVLL